MVKVSIDLTFDAGPKMLCGKWQSVTSNAMTVLLTVIFTLIAVWLILHLRASIRVNSESIEMMQKAIYEHEGILVSPSECHLLLNSIASGIQSLNMQAPNARAIPFKKLRMLSANLFIEHKRTRLPIDCIVSDMILQHGPDWWVNRFH